MSSTYESKLIARNGAFFASDISAVPRSAINDCIGWFLRRVGTLRGEDLDTNSRLKSLEKKVDQLCGAQADISEKVQCGLDSINAASQQRVKVQAEVAVQAEAIPTPPRPTRATNRVLEGVKIHDGRSPKRKKTDDHLDDGSKVAGTTQICLEPKTVRTQTVKPIGHPKPLQAAAAAAAAKDENSERPWTVVKRKARKVKVIAGKSTEAPITGGSATSDFVISGVRATPDVETQMLELFAIKNVEIDPKDIVLLTRDPLTRKTLTFKISIKREDKDTVFNEQFWPSNVFIRKFVSRR